MENMTRELKNIGFSDKEATVYLAALQLGLTSVQAIAKKSGVNRATTYVLIDSLIRRGLISVFVREGKKLLAAESPDKLISLLRLQKQELEEKERELSAVLPQLLAIYNVEGTKPQIRYLEGFDGVQSVMNFFEQTEGEFIQFVCLDEVEKLKAFFQYRSRHLSSLRQRGAPYRLLAAMDDPDFSKIPFLPGGEIRLIPTKVFPIKGDISVRGNTVFIYSFQKKMLGIVITSPDIANTVRQLFNLAWAGAVSYPMERR